MKRKGAACAGIVSLAMLMSTAGMLPATPAAAAGEITINEVCAKNTTYQGPGGGYYDWVELYNSSGSSVDISGWGFTDKEDQPYRFTFPSGTVVGAGQRLVFYCDGDAGANDLSIAPFGLSTSGETLVLTDTSGNRVSQVTFGEMAKDTSYGQYPEGSGEYYILSCTPGSPNAAPEGANAVRAPGFSAESGFYNSGFQLSIDVPAGTTVYYTTDGSDPTTASEVYLSPISIEDMTNTPNRLSARTDITANGTAAPPAEGVLKAALIRAVAVDSQGRVSDIVTKTYFVGSANVEKYRNMKVISLVSDPDNLFGEERGIYVLGKVYAEQGGNQGGWGGGGGFGDWGQGGFGDWGQGGFGDWGGNAGGDNNNNGDNNNGDNNGNNGGWGGFDNGGVAAFGGFGGFGGFMNPWDIPANYTQKGREWEREATLEMFENGQSVLVQDVGIRIKGAYSRSAVQKSFNVYTRADYGKGDFEYDFFNGEAVKAKNGKAIKKFDGITIRNGGNDVLNAYFRDSINQKLVADRNMAVQTTSECILFLDGEFWGIYQLMEKVSADYINSHYGIKKNDVVIIKNNELEEGTDQDLNEWNSLVQRIANSDMSSSASYDELCRQVDIQSYIDYFAAQIYWSNDDWPQNNVAVWRSASVDDSNEYSDGRWRMFLFDTESGLGLYGTQSKSVTADSFSRITRNTDSFSKMFASLLKNPEFKKQFELTMMDMINYNFDPEKATKVIDYYKNNYKQQIIDTYERFDSNSYSGNRGEQKFQQEYSTITDFYNRRFDTAVQTMQRSLGLTGSLASITVSNDGSKGSIELNTLKLDDSLRQWSGKYYTDYPVTVRAKAKEGSSFDHWEVSGASVDSASLRSPELTIALSGDVTVTAVYSGGGSVIPPQPEKVKGDYNNDGICNVADMVVLRSFLQGKKVDIYPADVIEDNKTDIYDLVGLRKLLLG